MKQAGAACQARGNTDTASKWRQQNTSALLAIFFSLAVFPHTSSAFFEDDYDFVWVPGWLRNVGFRYLKVIPLRGSCVSRVGASVFSPRLSGTEIFEVKTCAGGFWSHVELKRSLLTDTDNSYKKRDTAWLRKSRLRFRILIRHNLKKKKLLQKKWLNFNGRETLFLLKIAIDLVGSMTWRKLISSSCMLFPCEQRAAHMLKPKKRKEAKSNILTLMQHTLVAKEIHLAPNKVVHKSFRGNFMFRPMGGKKD